MINIVLQQVAKDPRTNEVFKVMDKICVSNMDETMVRRITIELERIYMIK